MGPRTVQSRIEVLSRAPIFSAFNPDELRALADLAVEMAYRRGDTVCREGEEGDALFVCASGELEVWGGAPRRVINVLGTGEVLGEMSLLLGGKRAATVTAARSTHLLAFNRGTFDRYFLQNAKVLQHLSKVLTQRLATMARGEVIRKAYTTVAVTAAPGLRGTTLVASSLAALLADFSGQGVVHVLIGGRPSDRAVALDELATASLETVARHVRRDDARVAVMRVAVGDVDESRTADALTQLLLRLGETFPILVLEGQGNDRGAVVAAEATADVAVRIVDQPGGSDARPQGMRQGCLEVINLHNATSCTVPISHCEPFVLRDDPALHGLDAAAQAAHVRTHPWAPAAPALHRLARKILGTSVGIALGGGAAFGLAHIGVLKALEDNGVAVDLVAGCSMGSLVALGYCAGFRPATMVDIALRLGTKRTVLGAMLDFTLTRPALFSGDKVVGILGPLAGDVRNFDQLTLPCRVVATDIETGERIDIGTGPTEIAGRASCSIPMLWSPVMHMGRVLVDGGVVDPVPAEVVHNMGADICIAVNAVPQLKKGVETVLTTWYRRLKRLDPFSYLAGSQGLPNMLDLVMNTMQALQYELGNFKAISADVRINPDLSGLTWVEFYKPQALIDRGLEAGERAVPEIKRVIADRLARIGAAPDTTARAAAAADPARLS